MSESNPETVTPAEMIERLRQVADRWAALAAQNGAERDAAIRDYNQALRVVNATIEALGADPQQVTLPQLPELARAAIRERDEARAALAQAEKSWIGNTFNGLLEKAKAAEQECARLRGVVSELVEGDAALAKPAQPEFLRGSNIPLTDVRSIRQPPQEPKPEQAQVTNYCPACEAERQHGAAFNFSPHACEKASK